MSGSPAGSDAPGAGSAAEALACACCKSRPATAARALQAAPPAEAAALLTRVGAEDAARVLSAMSAVPAAEVLALLPDEARGPLLRALGPGLAAHILRVLATPQRTAVLACLPEEGRLPIHALLAHDPASVGAFVDPRALSVPLGSTVGEALAQLRLAPERAQDRLFVTGEGHVLLGAISVRALVAAEAQTKLQRLVHDKPESLPASARLAVVAGHSCWLHTSVMPVTDRAGRFMGVLHQSATVRRDEPTSPPGVLAPQPTLGALAELYGVSVLTLMRWAGDALGAHEDDGGPL